MNKALLCGRLTRDPEVRYSGEGKCVARYTLAVDRRGKDAQADFISIVAFDKAGEFADKYLHQGMKMIVTGRIQTGSYVNKDGQRVYTTDVIAEDQEFAEKRQEGEPVARPSAKQEKKPAEEEFMKIPEDLSGDGLPFN